MSGGSSSPFRVALERLTWVMGICLACIMLQVTTNPPKPHSFHLLNQHDRFLFEQILMFVLNFIFSDVRNPDRYIMNPLLYWLLTTWIPQIGWCLALLYLCRTSKGGQFDNSGSIKPDHLRLNDPLLTAKSTPNVPRMITDSWNQVDNYYPEDSLLGTEDDLFSFDAENQRLHSRDVTTSEISN